MYSTSLQFTAWEAKRVPEWADSRGRDTGDTASATVRQPPHPPPGISGHSDQVVLYQLQGVVDVGTAPADGMHSLLASNRPVPGWPWQYPLLGRVARPCAATTQAPFLPPCCPTLPLPPGDDPDSPLVPWVVPLLPCVVPLVPCVVPPSTLCSIPSTLRSAPSTLFAGWGMAVNALPLRALCPWADHCPPHSKEAEPNKHIPTYTRTHARTYTHACAQARTHLQ